MDESTTYDISRQKEWRASIDSNIKRRAKLLRECEKDSRFRDVVMFKVKHDILFYFEFFLYTDRHPQFLPDWRKNHVPFVLFDYQKEFILDFWEAVQQGQLQAHERTGPASVFVEKSRQMGLTWMILGVLLYAYSIHNMKCFCISKKQEDVDKKGDMKSHFEKLRFMIARMPQWMLPPGLSKKTGTECNKELTLSRSDGTGSITGEGSSPTSGRQGTYAIVFLDECAFIPYARGIDSSVSSAAGTVIYNSTPNGRQNLYFEKREKALQGHLRYHRLHWTRHPFYTQKWYEMKINELPDYQIAQEYDISYSESVKGRVYPEIVEEYSDVEYDERLPLYIGLDNSHGGQDPHAVIVMQKDKSYWNIIDYIEVNTSVTEMAHILARKARKSMDSVDQMAWYLRYTDIKIPIFVSDPYDTGATLNESTIYQEYKKVGIHLNLPKERSKKSQINLLRSNIHRLRFAKNAEQLLWNLMNAHYPERGDTSQSTSVLDKPVHDHTSHGRSAMEYLATYLLEQEGFDRKPKPYTIEIPNHVTGGLETIVQFL